MALKKGEVFHRRYLAVLSQDLPYTRVKPRGKVSNLLEDQLSRRVVSCVEGEGGSDEEGKWMRQIVQSGGGWGPTDITGRVKVIEERGSIQKKKSWALNKPQKTKKKTTHNTTPTQKKKKKTKKQKTNQKKKKRKDEREDFC